MSRSAKRPRGVHLAAIAALSLGPPSLGVPSLGELLPRFASIHAADPCALVRLPHAGASREDRTVRKCQELLGRTDDPGPYLERLGWAFVAKARRSSDTRFYELAEHCAHCIETRMPRSPPALLLRVHVLTSLHRFRDAELLARELVEARGEWFDHGALGDALIEQGKVDEAIAAYQRMMDERPGPQAYSRAAHVRWVRGDLAGALHLMRKAARATGSGDPEAAAWTRTHLALYELAAGRLDAASASITSALELEPDYAPALLARGRVHLARSEHAEAAAVLARAVELNPLTESRWALLEALTEAGRLEEAKRVETDLLQRGSIEDPRTLALYLASARRHVARALQLARRELTAREDVVTLDVMAWALRASGKLREARSFSDRALAEGTRDARLYYHAGAIASESGDRSRARHLLAQAGAMIDALLPSERRHLRELLASVEASRSATPRSAEDLSN